MMFSKWKKEIQTGLTYNVNKDALRSYVIISSAHACNCTFRTSSKKGLFIYFHYDLPTLVFKRKESNESVEHF